MPRYSTVFVNNKTKKIWTKSFRSKDSLLRAVVGILKKTNNQVKTKSGWSKSPKYERDVMTTKSKGFKYKKELLTHNRTKYRF